MFQNNAVFQIVGPSGSGKTHFVCKLLQHDDYFKNKFKQIYWHQGGGGESGLTEFEFCKLKNIKVVEGFDENWSKRLRKGDVIIIDDLYQEANKESDFNNLFTKIARHREVTVIFITQNLFHQGGNHRTRNLNVHYLVLFKNPRDQTVVDFVSRQAFPTNKRYLVDAFQDATKDPHGYLFIDFTQQCPDVLRVSTDLFNRSGRTVYKQL
jgi:energy-coupling factor transporter ATP-binding protein EcfA2